jgi:hypothetical protein
MGLAPLLLTLAGCSNGTPLERLHLAFTISSKEPVTVQEMERAGGRLTAIRLAPDRVHCQGGGGFINFATDSPIEVMNEQGRLLGQGGLGPGTLQRAGSDLEDKPLFKRCGFQVSIPLGGPARIYVLRIGGEGFVRRFHISQLRRQKGLIQLKVD